MYIGNYFANSFFFWEESINFVPQFKRGLQVLIKTGLIYNKKKL